MIVHSQGKQPWLPLLIILGKGSSLNEQNCSEHTHLVWSDIKKMTRSLHGCSVSYVTNTLRSFRMDLEMSEDLMPIYFPKGYNFYTCFYGHKFTRVTKHQPLVSIFPPLIPPPRGIPEMTAAILQCYALLFLAGLTFYTRVWKYMQLL